VGEQGEHSLTSAEQGQWLDQLQLDRELDNLRAALASARGVVGWSSGKVYSTRAK
jgi:hypothetical protein